MKEEIHLPENGGSDYQYLFENRIAKGKLEF